MSPHGRLRVVALPLAAAILISAVIGVQLRHGGGSFTPLRPTNPCSVREATSVSPGIDGLAERLVDLGLDRAACQLHISREALVLDLAQPATRNAVQINALRAGLLSAVTTMSSDRTLPAPSTLVDQVVDQSSLNGFLKAAIRAIPAAAINASFTTSSVLHNLVEDLDLSALLGNLSNPDSLTTQIRTAIAKAVAQSILARIRALA